jgi:hypothetical protein
MHPIHRHVALDNGNKLMGDDPQPPSLRAILRLPLKPAQLRSLEVPAQRYWNSHDEPPSFVTNQRIRELNDELRQHLLGGLAVMASGVAALGQQAVERIASPKG